MTLTTTRRLAHWACWAAAAAAVLFTGLQSVSAQTVKLGEGAYHLTPRAGDKPIPRAPFRTEAMLKRARREVQPERGRGRGEGDCMAGAASGLAHSRVPETRDDATGGRVVAH